MTTTHIWARRLFVSSALAGILAMGCSVLVSDSDDEPIEDDTGKDRDSDNINPGDVCDGACDDDKINECTCATGDPCEWSEDGVCDRDQCLKLVDEMFDDWEDCKDKKYNIYAVNAEILPLDPNGNPWDAAADPPDPYTLIAAGPSSDIFGFTLPRFDTFTPQWDEWLFDAVLWELEGTWLIQIWDDNEDFAEEDQLIGECNVNSNPNLLHDDALVVIDSCGYAQNLHFSVFAE